MMGSEAVKGRCSESCPCWMSTANATYQAMLTKMALRQSVACRGRRLKRKMAIRAIAEARI